MRASSHQAGTHQHIMFLPPCAKRQVGDCKGPGAFRGIAFPGEGGTSWKECLRHCVCCSGTLASSRTIPIRLHGLLSFVLAVVKLAAGLELGWFVTLFGCISLAKLAAGLELGWFVFEPSPGRSGLIWRSLTLGERLA